MSGDFTRDSFDPEKRFTRVLMQQGRPQLDADLNEQTAIFWRHMRTMMADLVGPFAGPHHACGFEIVTRDVIGDDLTDEERRRLKGMFKEPGEFLLGPGRYYVDGLLCENAHHLAYSAHVAEGEALPSPKSEVPYLVYLDVWESPVTAVEDPSIGEPALNGVDTSLRARVAWRVRIHELPDSKAYEGGDCGKLKEHWTTISRAWQPEHRGRLRAQVHGPDEEAERGRRPPEGGYRGSQNQLYRVEVHEGGTAAGGASGATFKVSRENGSVVFRIVAIDGDVVTLDTTGRDARFGIEAGDWVEIGEAACLAGAPGQMCQVVDASPSRRQVRLAAAPRYGDVSGRPHLLRRWDHKAGDPRKGGLELRDGAAVLREGEGGNAWLRLENGIRIQFQGSGPANVYRSGDYWLVPARVSNRGLLWPHEHGRPSALPPHGVDHHYAPLAIVSFDKRGVLEIQGDCRLKFKVPAEF